MKYLFLKISLVVVLSTLLSDCGKDKDADNDFYIEAEVNGVKWKGNQPGDPTDGGYLAVGGNSKMKFWISMQTVDVPQTFNFSSYDNVPFPNFTVKDTIAFNWFVGAFDSRIKLRMNTSFEKELDHFELEQAKDDVNFKMIAYIPSTGTSTVLTHYSYSLNSIDLLDIGHLKHRIKIITKSGVFYYTPATLFSFRPGTNQIQFAWSDNGKLYMALDNNQNQMTVTTTGPSPMEKTGTFSFNYINETGDTIRVKNGKFHVKQFQ